MQKELDDHNSSASKPFQIRIGISAGEPITEEENLFGAVVQLASRLCGWASSGRIAVSSAVRDMCIGKKIVFVDHGTVTLKGFAEDAHVYEVCCT